ncbi:MAG TPA: hypothetical protein PKV71_05280 [Calditrichia bacterium]|nr:hypothetical protein [Calditrichota bacterium]HQU71008.1 hypothetical protein [Calditrichia bacterium]HQV31265.1 hypothetical protein [Calditrichia bacterium]
MIEKFFKDLTEITGVEAVILYDNANSVLDSWAIPKYNPGIFTDVGETFLHAFGVLEHLNYDFGEIMIPFDRGLVYARSHSHFYLVIIARLSTPVPMLRLAVNVNLHDFLENRKVQKWMKKLSGKKFFQIKSVSLDDVEKIMLENMLEDQSNG